MRDIYRKLLIISLVLPLVIGVSAGCSASKNARQRQRLIENLDSEDADLRRAGVLMLAEGEAAGLETTPKLLVSLAQTDPAPQVRATSIQVLARIGAREKLLQVLPVALRDESVWVRKECVRALNQPQDEAFLNLLLEILATDPEATIRTEAAQGLGDYRYRGAIQGLIRALAEDKEFGVWYRAQESLKKLTGKEFGYDPQAWQRWFETAENPFSDKT